MPAGMTFVSAEDVPGGDGAFLCGESGGVVTCTGGTLDGSANLIPGPPDLPTSRTLQIVVRAPEVRQRVVHQPGVRRPVQRDRRVERDEQQREGHEHRPSPYNLKLDKDGPTTAQQNNTEDYVITVTNEGKAVDDVLVVDPLPIGLIPMGYEADGNFGCSLTENPVNVVRVSATWQPGARPRGTITIHVFITQDGGTLDNEACVDPGERDRGVVRERQLQDQDDGDPSSCRRTSRCRSRRAPAR